MKTRFIFVICIVTTLFLESCSPSISRFKKIEIAYFQPKEFRDSLFISGYLSINSSGIVSDFDQVYVNKKEFYSVISLPKKYLEKLNRIFTYQSKLKTQEKPVKLKENEIYSGDYFYVKVEYDNGMVDSICTVRLFLKSDFNNSLGSVEKFIYNSDNQKQFDSFPVPNQFKLSLASAYKGSNQLPPITSLPPMKVQEK